MAGTPFLEEYGQGTGGIIEGKEKDPPAFGNTIKLSLPLWGRWHTEGVTERAFQTLFALSPAFGGSSPRGGAFHFLNLMTLPLSARG
jgi:hypothetical protein